MMQEIKHDNKPILLETEEKYSEIDFENLGSIKDIACSLKAITQAPMTMVIQSVLVAISSVSQRFYNVRSVYDNKVLHPTSLFAISVAKSGDRKSTAYKIAMRGIKKHVNEQLVNYNESLDKYNSDKRIFDKRLDKIERKIVDAKTIESSKIAEIERDALNQNRPHKPISPEIELNDITWEGLFNKYLYTQPSLALFAEEGSTFSGGIGMQKDNALKMCGGLSMLWDGSDLSRTRSGDGHHILQNKRLSMLLMIQVDQGKEFLTNPQIKEQGFFQRCLISKPESMVSRRKLVKSKQEDTDIVDNFNETLYRYLDTPIDIERKIIEHDEECYRLIQEDFDYVEEQQKPINEYANITGNASKNTEQLLRIASNLAFYRDPNVSMLTRDDIINARDISRFFLDEAKRILDAEVISKEIQEANKLSLFLMKNREQFNTFKRKDLVQYSPFRDMAKVKKLISILVEYNHIFEMDIAQGNRVNTYMINPEILLLCYQ